MVNDALFIKIVRDVNDRWQRRPYEELLVELGLYSISTLKDNEEYSNLTKYDLIFKTLRTHTKDDFDLLYELNKRHSFSKEVLQELSSVSVDLKPMIKTAESEKVGESNVKSNQKQATHTAYVQQTPIKDVGRGRTAIGEMRKRISKITGPQAVIIAAVIGAICGCLGIVAGAFLNPYAQKLINQPEPTPNPTSLVIEQVPFTIYTYDGERDSDITCCAGWADFEYVNNANLSPEYLLNYALLDDNSKYSYAGIAFVFAQSQNLSEYQNIEFTITFGDQVTQIEFNFEDIAQTKEPYRIVGEANTEGTYIVPLTNFGQIDFKAIRALSFQVDSDFILGSGKFGVKNIHFTK